MGTPAVVYIESKDQVIRVNWDGYPEHMLPTLERIIEDGLLEAFASQSDYSGLSVSVDEYARDSVGVCSVRYVPVENVGIAYSDSGNYKMFRADDGSFVGAGPGGSAFTLDFDYSYTITADGKVKMN